MVIPVNKNTFKVKTTGSGTNTYVSIANMESFEISFDATTETWSAFEQGGYQNALKTGLALSLSFDCKRTYGDAGNEELWKTAYEVGEDANREFQWTMVDGTVVEFEAVVSIDSVGGDSTAVETMSVTLTVVGRPTVTPANNG